IDLRTLIYEDSTFRTEPTLIHFFLTDPNFTFSQVTLWQFLDHTPIIKPVTVAIKTDLPGFQWKGYAPLRVRTSLGQGTTTEQAPPSNHSLSNRHPPPQLQATGIILVQPPARITALGLAETPSSSVPSNQCNPYGLLVALGTPHGYSVVHLRPVKPPPSTPPDTQTLWTESTLPDNLDALQEAAAGEGWARRRTRELKKSLRDSFRRLKRMRSTKMSGHPHAVITTEAPAPASSAISRAGVRRTVTQTNRVVGRPVHSGPLEEAERRARGDSGQLGSCSAGLPTVSIEREICDRSSDSASVAIVTCFAFGPPLFRFSSNPLHGHTSPSNQSAAAASVAANCAVGSLFVGTKAGMVKAYALFSDRELNSPDNPLSTFRLQLAKQLILQHRAPILTVRLVDNKSFQPLPSMCLDASSTVNPRSPNMPNLLVVSEEQVRLFSLPGLRLKFKARITAKDGYRIKTGAVMAFRPCGKFSAVTEKIGDDSACVDLDRSNVSAMSTPLHSPPGENSAEYSFVLSNVGGQAIVLGMPGLARRDTLGLLDASDVVAVNSVTFAEPGCSTSQANNAVIAPALGLYQLAPGQLTMFDLIRMGQRASFLGASYRPIHRLPEPGTVTNTVKLTPALLSSSRTALSNGSTVDTSGISSRGTMPPPSSTTTAAMHAGRSNPNVFHNSTTGSASYAASQLNSSILSNTLSDSVRNCFTPPSGSSFVST
ncbi:putative inorganic pyrophosphatase, partial [Fasciola hepatica]